MILLLIFMFFLGATQLIWALVALIVTPHRMVRRHVTFYFIGVAAYFSVLFSLGNLYDQIEHSVPYIIFFVGGAFALAIYHMLIMLKRGEFF
jgi:hypothetical protein